MLQKEEKKAINITIKLDQKFITHNVLMKKENTSKK